jgi:hypothetical protein
MKLPRVPGADKLVLTFIVAGIMLWFITSIINVNVITGKEPVEELFKEVVYTGQGGLLVTLFTVVIVGAVIYFAFKLMIGFGTGKIDRKTMITMIIMGVLLYYLWNKILVPSGWVNLKEIEFTGAVLQSMIMP